MSQYPQHTNGVVAADALRQARRVVVKVGSALLVDASGAVNRAWLERLGDDLAALRARKTDVVIVTSGAIALGRRRLGLTGALRLEESQAASAAGQAALIDAWQAALGKHDINVAQVLLTIQDTEDRRRYLNARATLEALLRLGALPVINENDTVATSEIRYGDNDRLAAHTAQITGADLLVILSDVDGFYTSDPRTDPTAEHVPFIEAVSDDIVRRAGGANKSAGVGVGGMATKIAAAKIASANGCATLIAKGALDQPLSAVETGMRATLIAAGGTPDTARKAWIRHRLAPAGKITIDEGARDALKRGASLLAAGVTSVAGDFARGDAISILCNGDVIGQGISALDAADLTRVKGLQSEAVDEILGVRRRAAVIDRNDLVLATKN